MTIWKFPFPIRDQFAIEMPADSKIVLLELQGGEPCLWAIVHPRMCKVTRRFRIVGTGHPIEAGLEHVASFQQLSFVWHLFEVMASKC